MTETHRSDRFDTSDAARLKRGWRTADVWLATVLSLAGLMLGALPQKLVLSAPLRLEILRQIRKLEALVRRLSLALATASPVTAAERPAHMAATKVRPFAVQHITLDPARLGLAQHWRPQDEAANSASACSAEPDLAKPRAAISPTVSLVEAWPDLGPSLSDHPFQQPGPTCRAPRILCLDAPWQPPPDVTRPALDPDNKHILKRLAALRAVTSDPARMVRRMRSWLARRRHRRDPAYRPSPLCIGTPRLGWTPDERDIIKNAQFLARDRLQSHDRRLWCDSG